MFWLTVISALYFFLPAYLANMFPSLAKNLPLLDYPIWEKKLGKNKTWRGVLIATLTGGLIFWLQKLAYSKGFTSWAIIFHLKALKVPYMIFWRKNGNWYEKDFSSMKDGECKEIQKKGNYHLDKTTNKVSSNFVLIKQHRYKNKKYNWIFATNVKFESAEAYVKRYKKRWGIETIYRVTDDIRAYTTSTKAVIRCFLFMITCFVYNIWRCFQMFLGESFTLANFKCCIIILLAKIGRVFPNQYLEFENIGKDMF